MANIFDKEISFITEEEVKETTTKTDLKALDDEGVKILISKAEDTINNYLGYVITVDDTNSYDLKVSAFYTVEQIFESWDLITSATTTWWEVIQEKTWDRTIQYSEWSTSANTLQIVWIPTQAKVILDKYKNIFLKQVI